MQGPGVPMKARAAAALALVALAATAGCVAGQGGGNTNLPSPKLVVDLTPEGETVLYVHAAFTGERLYERIRASVDNTTTWEDRHVYAWSHKTTDRSLFLDVEVEVQDGGDRSLYHYAADLRVTGGDDPEVAVTPWVGGERQAAQTHDLPYHKVIAKADGGA